MRLPISVLITLILLMPLHAFAANELYAGLPEYAGYGGPPYFNGESGVATEVKLKDTKGGVFYNNDFYFADSGHSRMSWDNREAFGYHAPNEDEDGNGTYFELNLRFPGQWFDKETGLFHNGFRDYNPSTGRYMQSDPLGLEAGFNTYAYVGSNPYRAVDPYGLKIVFEERVASIGRMHLEYLSRRSPSAKFIIDSVMNDPYTITVMQCDNSYQKGNVIGWNPMIEFYDTNGNVLADGGLALFHEIYHAYQYSTASSRLYWGRERMLSKIMWSKEEKFRWTNPVEKDAIEMEAQVWREMGQKNTRSSHNRDYKGNPYKVTQRNSFILGH